MYGINDTIVALATPPGEGAIGIIRLSGPDAITITEGIFEGKKLSHQPSHTIHFGKIVSAGNIIDEVVVSLFKGPKSYTGENIIEISCHGSYYILQQVIGLCTQAGARIAKPGEFTERAYLNGKLDLAQAEAVADLIASNSEAAHKSAMHNLRGGFSSELKEMREELIKFSALIELELDFSEEDVEFADRTQLYKLLGRLTARTEQLVSSFRLGNVIKNGVSVAIIGKPNAGKSTLLNALLNEERAIVSEIAGTTRDSIEETLNINGILYRLIDTAGIREHTTDVIESIGVQRSKDIMNRADIVVYLFDANDTSLADLHAEKKAFSETGLKYLFVGNKADKATAVELEDKFNALEAAILYISAKNKENITGLKQNLYELVVQGNIRQEGTIVTNARHHAALHEVLKSLHDIKAGMDQNITSELIALDIRRCLHYLGEITGQVTTEDKLDYIFSKFCIGK
jgi:tRNA modification GTPase